MRLSLFGGRVQIGRAPIELIDTPDEKIPASAERKFVALQPANNWDKLLLWMVASICVVFALTRLDAITGSPAVHNAIKWFLEFASLYIPFFPERMWSGVTCMWVHGSFMHLAGNMLGMLTLGYFLTRAYGRGWWLLFFLVGGTIGNVTDVLVGQNPGFDWASYNGSSLVGYIWGANTPLGGASGGVFAMLGACLAAGLRYWLVRKQGIQDPNGRGTAIQLLVLAGLQFAFMDWGNESIAGLAHQAGMGAGFVLGLLPSLRGRYKLLTTNPKGVGLRSIVLGKPSEGNLDVQSVTVFLKPEFNPEQDSVLYVRERIDFRGRVTSEMLAYDGKLPKSGDFFVVADAHSVPGYSVQQAADEPATPGK